jgi:hypothetical protein
VDHLNNLSRLRENIHSSMPAHPSIAAAIRGDGLAILSVSRLPHARVQRFATAFSRHQTVSWAASGV